MQYVKNANMINFVLNEQKALYDLLIALKVGRFQFKNFDLSLIVIVWVMCLSSKQNTVLIQHILDQDFTKCNCPKVRFHKVGYIMFLLHGARLFEFIGSLKRIWFVKKVT